MDEQLIFRSVPEEESKTALGVEHDSSDNIDVEALVAQICFEINGAVDQAVVNQIAEEMAARYRDARITAFVPIFIRRDVINLLRRT